MLKAIKTHLQSHKNQYLPELFTFTKPESRDLVEAITGFAALSRFVIADLTTGALQFENAHRAIAARHRRFAALSQPEVLSAIGGLPGWTLQDGTLVKTYTHGTFPEAIVFVNAVAHLAELADHHPDVDIRYTKITLRLITHDAGGITKKDIALAKEIEEARAKAGAAG